MLVWITIGLLLLGFGCSKSEPEAAPAAKPAKPAIFDPMSVAISDPDLIEGRKIWMETCTACHLRGLVGAPKIGDKEAWAPRIAKGLETLYDHAINGFIGPELTEMPARGGFSELTDDQVKQAVRFVVHASQ